MKIEKQKLSLGRSRKTQQGLETMTRSAISILNVIVIPNQLEITIESKEEIAYNKG